MVNWWEECWSAEDGLLLTEVGHGQQRKYLNTKNMLLFKKFIIVWLIRSWSPLNSIFISHIWFLNLTAALVINPTVWALLKDSLLHGTVFVIEVLRGPLDS